MKTLSLKTRFAIFMSIGALALVIGMGAISMHFARDDLLKTLTTEQLDMVSRVADELDGDLKEAADALTVSVAAVPRDVVADPVKFNAFFTQSPALLQTFEGLLLLNTSGIVTASFPNRDLVGLNLADRRYFQRAMASAKPVISDPLHGKATGQPIVNIAAPLLDADGSVAAVMVGVLPLSKKNFLGEYSTAKIGRDGYFTVITTGANGVYLAHPDLRRLLQPVATDTSQAMSRMVNATTAGSIISSLDDGSDAVVTYKPLKTTNWVLAAVLPGDEAFATIAHARTRTIQVGVFAALIVLPLVWSFAWVLFRPISRLRAEVEEIAGNRDGADRPALATVGRNDEVGEVAIAFNAMLAGQRASEDLRLASDQDRRRLVAILESSQDFVAMADVRGRLTYLNAAGRRLRGLAVANDLKGTVIASIMPPWAVRRLEDEALPAALRDGVWLGESAVLDRDGNEVSVDHTVIAHRNVTGGLEFFSSLMHDTSATKAASIEIRASEARMLSIADALPLHVSFLDRECRYKFVNSIYERHFGVDKSYIHGKTVAELIGPDAYVAYQPFFERAARGEPQVFEVDSRSGVSPAHLLVKIIPQFDDARVVTGYHFIHQDVTDHKAEKQRLSQLIRADTLTGLLNRAGFETAIVDAMARSQQHLSAMGLFYLDVDRFKSVNDQYGHQIGDKLLRAFAARLVRAVRGADIVARLGGDEFVVIAEGVRNVDDVRAIAGKILRAMRPAFDFGDTTLSVTASIGIAIYSGEAIKLDELIHRADAALYRAKDNGRNCYALDDEMQTFGTTTLLTEHPELATD